MAISLTDKAKTQLLKLDINHDQFLRVWVEAGGCQGHHYQAAIDTQRQDDDVEVYKDQDLSIIADRFSTPFFAEVDIDYSDDLMKAGFKFTNRQAVSTCGCGSFKTAETAGATG
ncbi:HesB/IscA family protein [Spirochaeta lutea]|uniref:Core domain-containing protein n=1 Tax=Spirochaeta lutea TaxID=1480694 RepID=A0A098R3W3_9SPIO|nr:iron-sulfur cluster assembly accessory protein [Spirochaeta lutea]KGE73412.1 hypothetical protein DC28_03865 [Spirochaeta lutea]